MTDTNQITRRHFLRCMTLLTIPVTGMFHKTSLAQLTPNSPLHHIGLALVNASFQNRKNAFQLGKAYLREFPIEHSLSSLLNVIFEKNPSLLNTINKNKNHDLMLDLQQVITKDFENEDTINIDGWVLAKTEARLSALATFV